MWRNHKYLDDHKIGEKVEVEIERGLEVLNNIKNPVITVYGSHLVDKDSPEYNTCYDVAYALGEKGYAVATGGGPGIMQAANSAAKDAGAPSIGFKGALFLGEYIDDDVHTHVVPFEFVFARRFALHIKSDALLFFPGGLGTLDELSEIIVLVQCGILDKVPIICVGRDHWAGLFEWIEDSMLNRGMLQNKRNDLEIVDVVDTFDEIMNVLNRKLK